MRRCTTCGELKPLDEFYSYPTGKNRCKACKSVSNKRYNLKNREKRRLYNRQYRIDHRAEIYAQNKKYRDTHPEFMAEQYNRRNAKIKTPEGRRRSRAYKHMHKARKAQLLHDLTKRQWDVICEIFEHECAYCDQPLRLEQDHFVPLVKGGGYTVSNIVPACLSCNRQKCAATPRDFVDDEGRYEAIVMLISDAEYCVRQEDDLC